MNPETPSYQMGSEVKTVGSEMDAKTEDEKADTTGLALPNGSAPPPKRGRGRPLGSVNKRPKPVRIPGKRGRPRKPVDPTTPVKAPGTGRKRGRPRKEIKRRGRPRKIPLTPEEEEERRKMKAKPKGPRVWKPLGRPRIYPRVDPPVPPPPSEPRGRGRPRKSQSRQGAHFRKNNPTPAPPRPPPADGLPRKRGRPPGSVKKNDAKLEQSVSSPTSDSDSQTSPPPTKRSRRSSGKVDEPQDRMGKDTGDSTGSTRSEPSATSELDASRNTTEDCEESLPVATQRKRGRPRNVSGQAAQEDKDRREARKHGSGKKAAVPKKTALGKGSKNGKPEKEKTLRGGSGRKNISSIL